MGSLTHQALLASTRFPEYGKPEMVGVLIPTKMCLTVTIQLHPNEGHFKATWTTALRLALLNHCSLFSSVLALHGADNAKSLEYFHPY